MSACLPNVPRSFPEKGQRIPAPGLSDARAAQPGFPDIWGSGFATGEKGA